MKTFELKGKKILVTGASGFLGEYIVKALLEENAYTISVDLNKDVSVDALDISDPEAIDRYVQETKRIDEKLDGIVNNAAISLVGKDLTTEQITSTLNVNVVGTCNMMTKFKSILSEDASIVNIASVYGMLSPNFKIYEGTDLYNSAAYGFSKAAIIQMTKYYAAQFAPIRVNSVSPGGIFNNQDKAFLKKYSEYVPLKRMADPEEIVNTILFLLSPLSSYVNGHNLVADGGLSVW